MLSELFEVICQRIAILERSYTYDGLYKVVDDWVQNGVQGYVVFKFKLKQLKGQPSLTTSEVRFTRAEAPTTISELPGMVCDDISGGQGNIPIPASIRSRGLEFESWYRQLKSSAPLFPRLHLSGCCAYLWLCASPWLHVSGGVEVCISALSTSS